MKLLAFILVFYTLQLYVYGWVGRIAYNSTRPHRSHCDTDLYNIGELNESEEKRIEGICAKAVCLTNRDIYISGCGTLGVAPPCYIVDGDLSKPYPECCFEVKCPDDNKL